MELQNFNAGDLNLSEGQAARLASEQRIQEAMAEEAQLHTCYDEDDAKIFAGAVYDTYYYVMSRTDGIAVAFNMHQLDEDTGRALVRSAIEMGHRRMEALTDQSQVDLPL